MFSVGRMGLLRSALPEGFAKVTLTGGSSLDTVRGAFLGCRGLGFGGLGFRGLGFRGLGV